MCPCYIAEVYLTMYIGYIRTINFKSGNLKMM